MLGAVREDVTESEHEGAVGADKGERTFQSVLFFLDETFVMKRLWK